MKRLLAFALLLAAAGPALALDAFDRHTSFWLRTAVRDAKPVAELTQKDADGLKRLAEGIEHPAVIVKTNDGNLAKLLLNWGFRRSADRKVTPVLMIERYVTYTNGRGDLTCASGKNIMLFPGFGFNLDIGQVVPGGHGADLEFTASKTVKAVDKAEMFTLNGSVIPGGGDGGGGTDPTDHDGVIPEDFAGNWDLNVDGRWKAQLMISIDNEGTATGNYVSEETKSSYALTGRVSRTVPHRLTFEVDFGNGNSKQQYEAFLWTQKKATMAGSATLDTQRFGFVASRQRKVEKGEGK